MNTRTAGIGATLVLPIGVVAVLGVVLAGRSAPLAVDTAVLDWFVGQRSPTRTGIAEAISAVCGYAGTTVVAVIAASIVAVRDRDPRRAIAPVVAIVGAMAVTETIKLLVARPRPPSATRLSLAEQTFSYPSGHAAGASACLITVAVVLTRSRRSRRIAVWCAAGWAIVVAACRLYLGVHWLTDVVAGLIVGATVAVVVTALLVTAGARSGAPGSIGRDVSDTSCGPRQPDR